MKHTAKSLPRSLVFAGFAAALLVMALPVQAQTYNWVGGNLTSTSWGGAGNFSPVATFNSTANLSFNSTAKAGGNATYNASVGANRTVRSLTFGSNITTDFNTIMSTSSVLTLQAASGNATLNILSGATGNINFVGNATLGTGSVSLSSNLTINHDGSGTLLFNRQFAGSGGFTKNGAGTFVISAPNNNSFTGAVVVNDGRMVMGSTFGATGDMNGSSGVQLSGGTLEIKTSSAIDKVINPNITVSSASTLAYNNTAATDQSLSVGTGSLSLSANLTVQNISSSVAGNNIVNISRNITGSGSLIVDTYNDVASGAVAFSNGRVQLSGNNTAWTGNLVVAKGTAQFSGVNSYVPAAGSITLGTTGSAFGAGLGFNQLSTDVTLANAINVTSGGVRLIRNNAGPGSSNNITLNGNLNLDGTLTLDHAGLGSGKLLTVGGNSTGVGGLNISFDGPHAVADTAVRLTGTNTYSGATTVNAGARLLVDGSLGASSAVTVANGATLGGDGAIAGSLFFASGANYIFNTTATLDVSGPVTFGGFSMTNLLGLSSSTIAGSYVLLNGTGSNISSSNISNLGAGNAFNLGSGNQAYFDFINGDLAVIVGAAIPEPGSFALFGGFAVFAACASRRRRRAS